MRLRGTCLHALSPRRFNRSVQRDNPYLNLTFAAEASISRAERSNAARALRAALSSLLVLFSVRGPG